MREGNEDHGMVSAVGTVLITRYAAKKFAVWKKGNQLLKDGMPKVRAPSSTTPPALSTSRAQFKSRQDKMLPKRLPCNHLQPSPPSLAGPQ
jgi:hypothetical protein